MTRNTTSIAGHSHGKKITPREERGNKAMSPTDSLQCLLQVWPRRAPGIGVQNQHPIMKMNPSPAGKVIKAPPWAREASLKGVEVVEFTPLPKQAEGTPNQ